MANATGHIPNQRADILRSPRLYMQVFRHFGVGAEGGRMDGNMTRRNRNHSDQHTGTPVVEIVMMSSILLLLGSLIITLLAAS